MLDDVAARKADAEILRIEAETLLAEERRREVEHKNEDWERFRLSEGAEAIKSGVYVFDNEVDENTVRDAIAALDHQSRLSGPEPLTIILCSPGGGVYEGFMLYDFIQDLRGRGHHVTIKTLGYAASMGGVLAQAGDWRVMGANSYLMIHEPSQFGGGGKASEFKDDAEHLKTIVEHMVRIFEPRSTLSATQLRKRFEYKDWWVNAAEALKLGFVDEIVAEVPFTGAPAPGR